MSTDADDLERLIDDILADEYPIQVGLERAASDTEPDFPNKLIAAGLLEAAVPEGVGGLGLPSTGIASLMLAAGRGRMPAAVRDAILVVGPVLATGVAEGSIDPDLWEGVRRGSTIGSGRAGAHHDGTVHVLRDTSVLAVVTPAGVRVVCLPNPSVRLQRISGLDLGQGLHSLEWSADSTVVFDADRSSRILSIWQLGLLAETVGCAEEALAMASKYARERVQFGRPIAAFQAIAHLLANMKVDVETSRSAVAMLAASLDASDLEASEELALSFSYSVPKAAREVCEGAIQVHGGVGFTWELGLHLYYRRVLSTQALLGGADATAAAVGEAYTAKHGWARQEFAGKAD